MKKKIDFRDKALEISEKVQNHVKSNNMCKCDKDNMPCDAKETIMVCKTVRADNG